MEHAGQILTYFYFYFYFILFYLILFYFFLFFSGMTKYSTSGYQSHRATSLPVPKVCLEPQTFAALSDTKCGSTFPRVLFGSIDSLILQEICTLHDFLGLVHDVRVYQSSAHRLTDAANREPIENGKPGLSPCDVCYGLIIEELI